MTTVIQSCKRLKLKNCGAYIELPWLRVIAESPPNFASAHSTRLCVLFTADEETRSVFLHLLLALRDSARDNLLDGTRIWDDFQSILSFVQTLGISFRTQTQVSRFSPGIWATPL